MSGGGRILKGLVLAVFLAGMSGCVSLDRHKRLEQAHRLVTADKEHLGQELFDERSVNDSLRTRVDSLERERASKDDLVANLKSENDLLDEMRRTAAADLKGLAGKMPADITILAPKLPAPLDSALKRFADEHPSEVVYDPAKGSVKWKADLLFALGSDEVKSTSLDALRGFTEILKSPAAADFEVVVTGHTDTRPISRPGTKEKHPTNWHLSAHRALAVGMVLQKDGYAPSRIAAMGCGEHRPGVPNDNESNMSLNRRVEIYLVPVGSVVHATAAGRQIETDTVARTPGRK